MNKNTTRATAVVGTTMALVIAGTAAVAAAGPRDRDDMRGFGGQRIEGQADMQPGLGMGGMRGMRGGMGGGLRGLDADVERLERTVQTADGITTVRTEQGVVDTAAADSLNFSLASGEAVTVVIDEDTRLIAFEEQEVTSRRGLTRSRMSATEIEAGDIAAGAEVIVTSDAEGDEAFVASRIVLQPAETDDVDAEAEAADADEAVAATEAEDEATDDATTTDA